MSSFAPFGKRQVIASIDTGGNVPNNAGNYTAVFTPQVWNLPQGQFEIQKGTVSGGTPGGGFSVFNETYQLDGGVLDLTGSAQFYKASDGEFVIAGGIGAPYVYVYFDSGNPSQIPTVNLWICYDPDLRINREGLFS